MAQRRMFSKQIVDTDDFLDMPLSAQALYLHLLIRADDDGFVGNTKRIMGMIGAREDDKKVLLAKRFILPFETSSVIVIKHWLIHNNIRKDRYVPTTYIDEKSQLEVQDNNAYTEVGMTLGMTSGTHRLGKVSLEEVSIVKSIVAYLNEKINSNYKHTSNKTKSLVQARINDGFTYDDFVTVIDKKYKEWFGTDMAKFLRPETLFGTKFEGYLNQIEVITIESNGGGLQFDENNMLIE